jgi:hypothetical protein
LAAKLPFHSRPVADGPLSAQYRKMTPPSNDRPPSHKRIGGRVRVRSDRANDAARLFEEHGFAPIYVEHRDDSDVSFWFGKEAVDVLYRIATCIPREFYAVQGVVVGDSLPFSPGAGNGG